MHRVTHEEPIVIPHRVLSELRAESSRQGLPVASILVRAWFLSRDQIAAMAGRS